MRDETYDEKQMRAMLVCCAICRRSYYMTLPQPICVTCLRAGHA